METGSAFALGLLAALYPCTMVTNITAFSWLASDAGSVPRTVCSGIAYAFGRALTYTLLGALISWAALSHVRTAEILQHYAALFLGPLLIIVGMFVSRLLSFGKGGVPAKLVQRLSSRFRGIPGAFLMGMILALLFCPGSAALFFGSIALGLAAGVLSSIALPSAFGIGTALPVIAAAVIFARSLTTLERKVTGARWFKRRLPAVSGACLIVLGVYLTVSELFAS